MANVQTAKNVINGKDGLLLHVLQSIYAHQNINKYGRRRSWFPQMENMNVVNATGVASTHISRNLKDASATLWIMIEQSCF